jgi:RND family efflux transporter MFP subunit
VKLHTVEVPSVALQQRFLGRIAAKETVDLAFQVGGQIIDFPTLSGSRVASNSILAQLDLAPLERAVRQAELALSQAERQVERNQQLIARNAITTAEVQDSETQRDLAVLSLDEARTALADATLRAPFAGLVAERIVPNLTTVAPGQPVLRLHDMSEIRVRIDVPERLLTQIEDPTVLRYELELIPGGPRYALEFREFVAEAGRIGQSYTVILSVRDVLPQTVLPGATATVIAQLPMTPNNLMPIPRTAVQIDPQRQSSVLVFSPTGADTGTLSQRLVELHTEDGVTLMVSAGLTAGEEIVAVGAHLLEPGQTVRRFTGYRGDN